MAEDKILVFNIRKDAIKTPKWRRSKDAMAILIRDVAKHSTNGKVKIDQATNELMWRKGGKWPQLKFRLKVKKMDDGSVQTEYVG